MTTAGTLKLTTPGERDLVMTRSFDAPRQLVFDAHTKPALVRRWLLGPPGWSMPVCEIDLRVGGTYRYVWQHDRDGTKMGMGGVYREIKMPERIVNTEKFDEAWYPGEALGTLVLVEQRVEALVISFPQTAIAFQPLGSFSEPLGLEAARPPLRVAAARNQAGAL